LSVDDDHLVVAVHQLIGVDVPDVGVQLQVEVVGEGLEVLPLGRQIGLVEHLAEYDADGQAWVCLSRIGNGSQELADVRLRGLDVLLLDQDRRGGRPQQIGHHGHVVVRAQHRLHPQRRGQ
jgi:hypothetical protein